MYNFSAGPAQLPKEVLNKAKEDLLDWHGCGMSVMEMPFTSDEYKAISEGAHNNLRRLVNLPDDYHILFLQGGAYAHFAFVAMNLLGQKKTADYIQTGHWSTRALNEARRYGDINIAASAEHSGFNHIPPYEQWRLNPEAAYCHITTNETANGVQFHAVPDLPIPLVADVTSDFLTRQLDISQFGLIYASAQKNIGPTGLTIAIIHSTLLNQAMEIVPAVFNYGRQASNNGRVNTPPTYSIYIAGLMFSWLLEQGGIKAIEQANRHKAKRLYELIDNDSFYQCTVVASDRSIVNICFELTDNSRTEDFLSEARKNGFVNLKGHGIRGGIRASLYNAMPVEGVDALITFMQIYSSRHSKKRIKKYCIG
ncbi:3-phosphoserine/phosphohydroxythreonine transaminase [Methylophaga sp. OBS4]|uniref:3-phosphoserine/phosphohydroxythreonine transaminase n=1 Tax=Methylophaga sp. OBS4 TaxID=2991935 RepID=UPI002253E3DB|nr:3-phosphoserine/phosphohydroxythreonine transaminase [Methylophaga sp. OBS4]MCX4187044.1 3-phosphoserine/phosphohydroxythreonine transaminase [Methylophaga sp. OBS4]